MKKVTKNYEKVPENEEDDLQEFQENRLVLKIDQPSVRSYFISF
jgi:hypothetical protein